MRHCDFCELETIPGASLMAAGDGAPGGVVAVCTKCGKAYKSEPQPTAAAVQAEPRAKVVELRPAALSGAAADAILEAARARLAIVDVEIARLRALQVERRLLARIVQASSRKEKP
jgi:hypothetical protein